jgi:DNA-binding XRE family transcriptional regulator
MAILSKRVTSSKVDPYVAPNREAAQRLVLAHSRGAEEALIASASLDDGTLYVWSCEPRLYRCAVKEISALAGLTKKQLANFEVSSSGSRLHWPDADVDINLDTIRVHVDPAHRKKAEVAFREEASLYAEAIKAVREKHGLRQADIARLSERQVRRLELGKTFPQIKTVEKLATAHGLSIAAYLKELARYSKRRSAS